MFSVREVRTDAEFAAVMAIQRIIFVEEQGIPEGLTLDEANAGATHVIALQGDKPVGTARLNIENAEGMTVGTIARVGVLTDYRSSGLGKKIVRELECLGQAAGVDEYVLRPHDYLEKFYKTLGYVRSHDGDHRIAGHELITMCKTIRSSST